MIRSAAWMTFFAFVAMGCGKDSGSGTTAETTGTGTGSGTGGGTGTGTGTGGNNWPSAPLGTDIDCANLPAALEGAAADDMLIRIGINIDLTCRLLNEVEPSDTGASVEMLTYQDWEPRMTIVGSFSDRWNVVSASAGIFEGSNYGGATIWSPPEGEDVTVVLTDASTETRNVELVFRFEPPYMSYMSLTEN